MVKKITFFLCLCAFSTSVLAKDSDIQIFDDEQKRQFTIRKRGNQFDIYDNSWRRRGFIRDDKIYDERWNRKGVIMKGSDTKKK